jgi:Ran GTPase-activating protein (RanGAP) involved in mRNA processing and transport
MDYIHCPIQGTTDLLPYDYSEIEPLLAFLKANEVPSQNIAFPKGTVTQDGRLDLCKQSIGAEGSKFVVEALWNNRFIKSILLGTDGIGNVGAAQIAELVKYNSHIETVYLGCNYIDNQGLSQITKALESNQSVKALWLKRNPIGEAGAKALADLLQKNQQIRTLDLVNTNIGEAGLQAICEVLADNQSLQRLYLGGNSIGMEGAKYLKKLLQKNQTIESILLNVNALADKGLAVLAEGIAENRSLSNLGLASNGIGESGMLALFDALQAANHIQFLDLGYGASSQVLGASANEISDKSAQRIADFLSQNLTLLSLNIQKTGISDMSKSLIERALAHNQTLCRLYMDGKRRRQMFAYLQRNLALNPHFLQIPADVQVIQSVYR